MLVLLQLWALLLKDNMNIDKSLIAERQIEVPLCKDYLLRQKALGAKRLAGIGDAECGYIDWIIVQGFDFTIIDPARWKDNQNYLNYISNPSVSILKRSIHEFTVTREMFDIAILISTIEHMGRSGYGSPRFQNPEVTCFNNIQVPFCMTTPAGLDHFCGDPPDRNYSQESLKRYLTESNKTIKAEKYYKGPDWKEVEFESIKNLRYRELTVGASAIAYMEIE